MRRVLMTALATAAIGLATPASAAVLVADGITYDLTLNSITNGGLTGNFTLAISGINTASDTEGGRTGINAFAFNDAATAVSGTSSGFTFQLGGLNSTGCDSSGSGWFCFMNAGYTLPSGSSTSLDFSVTNTTDAWDSWAPSFKIDWTGSQNNYDLVSLPIPVNTGVPEPATWAMMLLGFSGIGMAIRRSRKRNPALLQIA